MKIVNIIFSLMFMSFAFVQVNDPDPIVWILIYGAMAAVSVMAIFEFYIPKLMWLLLASYLIYGVILFPGFMVWVNSADKSLLLDDLAKMQYPYIEEAREFLGLGICSTILVFYLIRSYKNRPA